MSNAGSACDGVLWSLRAHVHTVSVLCFMRCRRARSVRIFPLMRCEHIRTSGRAHRICVRCKMCILTVGTRTQVDTGGDRRDSAPIDRHGVKKVIMSVFVDKPMKTRTHANLCSPCARTHTRTCFTPWHACRSGRAGRSRINIW